MAVSVIVPFRAGCPYRETAWGWVRASLEATHPDWEIVVGSCPDGPWRKALAVQDGIDRASGDRLVMHDADVWIDNLNNAVASPERVIVPHYGVWRLTEQESVRFMAGGDAPFEVTRKAYVGRPCGGALVFDRDAWDECPMDPRFAGWGQEDDSHNLAIGTLLGIDLERTRLNNDLIHLWHPESPRIGVGSAFGSEASQALWKRYRDASGDVAAMRDLIAETREAVGCR